MFERILVPVDFSERNRISIDHAANLADAASRVTLIHVIEEIQHLDEAEDQAFYTRLIEMAQEKMAELADYARDLGLETSSEVVIGKRTAEILTVARDRDVSIIVLNAQPVDWDQPLQSFGGTSHAVAVYAHCPVFLVK